MRLFRTWLADTVEICIHLFSADGALFDKD